MANFKQVNQAIKNAYPDLDIKAVRAYGYVYFDGVHGFDNVESIYVHPTSTSTADLTRFALENIQFAILTGKIKQTT